MARFTFTLEDNADGTTEIKSDQDLPFGHPERATPAQMLAMFLIRIITEQTKRPGRPKIPGLILPENMRGRN